VNEICFAGNLHLNIVGESHSLELLGLIEPFLFDWTGKHQADIYSDQ